MRGEVLPLCGRAGGGVVGVLKNLFFRFIMGKNLTFGEK